VATVVGVPQFSWTIQQTSPAVAAGNSGITLERLLLKFLQRLAGTFFGSMLAVVMALMLEVVGKDHGRHNQNHGPVGGLVKVGENFMYANIFCGCHCERWQGQ